MEAVVAYFNVFRRVPPKNKHSLQQGWQTIDAVAKSGSD
jgi:hypothetical protein